MLLVPTYGFVKVLKIIYAEKSQLQQSNIFDKSKVDCMLA